MIDFEIPGEVAELRDRVESFIAGKVVPYENDRYRDIRLFRIYDGPSKVHRHALARRIVSRNTHQRQ